MWEQLLQLVTTATVLAVLVLNIYFFVGYIRFKRRTARVISPLWRRMEVDDLVDQLLATDAPEDTAAAATSSSGASQTSEQRRARLAAIAAGGMAGKYLGKQLSPAQVDEMSDDEVFKHYIRYEARLGASMTKTLGASALQLYAMIAGKFLPIPPENLPKLASDLAEDPFVGHALTTACCELYFRYGMYLAPLTAAMTTAKHCRVKDSSCLANNSDDGDATTPRGGDDGGGSDLPHE